MAHGDAREGKWRGNWRMEWVASTLHTTSEHVVSSITTITTADADTSAASSQLNWPPPSTDLNGLVLFFRKMKSGFCMCAITFQMQSTTNQRSIPFGISFSCWFKVIKVLFYVFWSLYSWRSWWSRRQGVRRHHNGWFTNDLRSLSENVPEICLFHWWSFFLVKKQNSQSSTYSPQKLYYKDFQIIGCQIKEFCCHYSTDFLNTVIASVALKFMCTN